MFLWQCSDGLNHSMKILYNSSLFIHKVLLLAGCNTENQMNRVMFIVTCCIFHPNTPNLSMQLLSYTHCLSKMTNTLQIPSNLIDLLMKPSMLSLRLCCYQLCHICRPTSHSSLHMTYWKESWSPPPPPPNPPI